ncbi:hypothetical protein AVEN_67877-1 [Araneus ventricosus]|uniref:DUF4817 domain-containing protein n=1 Tax=Araneus ventricosus TaxID=182803 RepID=A0A4Y2HW80_ARAVE|nr:hypothetical protein AVEN_67877-1 [Araneus ventricosus]
MSKYGLPERISIVKAYYSSNNSPIVAQKKFVTEYKLKTTGPSVNVIEKFETTDSVDVSTLLTLAIFQNFALRLSHVIPIDGKHIEHVINKIRISVVTFKI